MSVSERFDIQGPNVSMFLNPYLRYGEHPLFAKARADACKQYRDDISKAYGDPSHHGKITINGKIKDIVPLSDKIDPYKKMDEIDLEQEQLDKVLNRRSITICLGIITAIATVVFALLTLTLASYIACGISLTCFAVAVVLRYHKAQKILDRFGQNAVFQAQEYLVKGPMVQADRILKAEDDSIERSLHAQLHPKTLNEVSKASNDYAKQANALAAQEHDQIIARRKQNVKKCKEIYQFVQKQLFETAGNKLEFFDAAFINDNYGGKAKALQDKVMHAFPEYFNGKI